MSNFKNHPSKEPDENTIIDGERLEDRVDRMVAEFRQKQIEAQRTSVAKPTYYEPHRIARTRNFSGTRDDRE